MPWAKFLHRLAVAMIVMSSMRWSLRFQLITPSKTNMDTHNDWLGNMYILPNMAIFGMVIFRGFLPDCLAETSPRDPGQFITAPSSNPILPYPINMQQETILQLLPSDLLITQMEVTYSSPSKGHQYATIQEISSGTHGPRTPQKTWASNSSSEQLT